MPRLALLMVAAPLNLLAQTSTHFISPFDRDNPYGTQTPFLVFSSQAPSVRYQQVYASSDFQNPGGFQWEITEISFSAGLDGMEYLLPNVQMALSTTQRQPDGLSSLFAENVGADNTVVFSGPLQLSAPGAGGFNLRIQLQQPFVYEPSAGNLLLEVKNFQTLPPVLREPTLGAYGTVGDTSSLTVALDVNSETALLGTGALFTRFTATAVPEPSSVALLLCGIGLAGVVSLRIQKGKGKGSLNVIDR